MPTIEIMAKPIKSLRNTLLPKKMITLNFPRNILLRLNLYAEITCRTHKQRNNHMDSKRSVE